MNETGTVTHIENGVAQITMPRTGACTACRLCICSEDSSTMVLTAQAPEGVKDGDRVTVEVDRHLRSRAQLWLLAIPLFTFLAAALITRLAFQLSDGWSLIISIAAMGGAFYAAWIADKRCGWSARPVARIVASEGESE